MPSERHRNVDGGLRSADGDERELSLPSYTLALLGAPWADRAIDSVPNSTAPILALEPNPLASDRTWPGYKAVETTVRKRKGPGTTSSQKKCRDTQHANIVCSREASPGVTPPLEPCLHVAAWHSIGVLLGLYRQQAIGGQKVINCLMSSLDTTLLLPHSRLRNECRKTQRGADPRAAAARQMEQEITTPLIIGSVLQESAGSLDGGAKIPLGLVGM